MAKLKKEKIEMAPGAGSLKSDADATMICVTAQQLLSKIHMT